MCTRKIEQSKNRHDEVWMSSTVHPNNKHDEMNCIERGSGNWHQKICQKHGSHAQDQHPVVHEFDYVMKVWRANTVMCIPMYPTPRAHQAYFDV